MSAEAIILAAGRGRRMRPLSDACHKALLRVGGTAIIERLVAQLVAMDVAAVHVVTGYRAGDVEAHLVRAFPEVDLRFVGNPRFAETNNVVSLARALDRITPGTDVILLEGDLVLAPGLLARLDGHRGNAALVGRHEDGMDGTVVRLRDGVVAEIIPPDRQPERFRYADTYKTLNAWRLGGAFCRDLLRPLVHAAADEGAYYEAVLGSLPDLAAHRFEAEIVPGGSWAEVDDFRDLAAARTRFARRAARRADGSRLSPSCRGWSDRP